MAVYVDVLLVINYIVNLLLLCCYAKFAGRRLKRRRLVAAALVGAVGSLSIFLPSLGLWFEILYRLALSAVMVLLAAFPRSFRAFCGDWFMFFAASFLFAGAMLALWMFARPHGMIYYNGIVYFDISAAALLMATTAAYFIAVIFWRIARRGRTLRREYKLTLQMNRRVAVLEAIVDTGNDLYEPFSGSPVAVCRMKALLPLFSEEASTAIKANNFEKLTELGIKLRFIPYKVVGGGGVMPAFRPDSATLNSSKSLAVEDIYIAISPDEMQTDALLHPDLSATIEQQ